MDAVTSGLSFFALMPLFFLLGIGINVLLGFCVYYDAKFYNDPNAVMWGVLSGFFNIAALIYIIMRVNRQKVPPRCVQCGSFFVPGTLSCTVCGRPHDVPPPEMMALYNRRRRRLFWGWIIAQVAVFVLTFVLVIVMMVVFSMA